MNIKEILNKGYINLKTSGIESPKAKARILLQFVLKKDYQYLVVYDQKQVSKEDEATYLEYISKVINGKPIEHITHQKEFMKLNFYVDENVLIPRADTEVVVENAIKILKINEDKKQNVLDMCTGSGVIGISLKKYVKNLKVTATDISKKALEVAKKNAKLNNTDITLICSDLFSKLDVIKKVEEYKQDLIISNPPYIETKTIKTLNKDVRKEPKNALDGGEDGLDFYRKISKEAKDYLKKDGHLIFEIGYNQGQSVKKILEEEKCYTFIRVEKDYYNNDRCVICKLK